jgi:hypothetical protein
MISHSSTAKAKKGRNKNKHSAQIGANDSVGNRLNIFSSTFREHLENFNCFAVTQLFVPPKYVPRNFFEQF